VSGALLHAPIVELDPRRADRAALRSSDRRLTYGELRRSVLGLAGWLRREGCRPGDRVAICLPKGVDPVVIALGTLAAGGIYVPLDPAAPSARLRRLLADAAPSRLFASAPVAARLTADGTIDTPVTVVSEATSAHGLETLLGPSPADAVPVAGAPDDLAAILYTSGTTGEPKGVTLSHRNIGSFVQWAIETFGCTAADRFANHAPLHFDLSTFDLFGAFASGASVYVLGDGELKFPAAVARVLERERITVWYSVPTALRLLVEGGGLDRRDVGALRLVLFAGEVFPLPGLRRLMSIVPGADYANLYGPTETNVCTYHRLPGAPGPEALDIPIGIPCEHLAVSICDAEGRPVAPGETGEICVAGPAVMRGYWNAPAATTATRLNGRADSFRTGDFGCRHADGEIRFLGRRDTQVKMRGHRVELLEVEEVLAASPEVTEAAVVLVSRGGGDGRLVSFVVARGPESPSARSILEHCSRLLPSYAAPDRIVFVDGLPRTSTGKIDRHRLRQRAETEETPT
jgi:amino acid adenylation domain-containing protein